MPLLQYGDISRRNVLDLMINMDSNTWLHSLERLISAFILISNINSITQIQYVARQAAHHRLRTPHPQDLNKYEPNRNTGS